jgi:hypothetical protein
MAIDPTEILKRRLKCRNTGLCIGIALSHSHQNANLVHVVGRLGLPREQPSGRAAAKQRDERAPR